MLAPKPISTPPPALRSVVLASAARTRNSRLAFAAINEPIKIPSTRKTPQLRYLLSPPTRNCRILAVGEVMPRPNIRPVASLSGQASRAIRPISTAVTNGCQRFSNSRCARPVRRGGREATLSFGLLSSLRTNHRVTATSRTISGQTEIFRVSAMPL